MFLVMYFNAVPCAVVSFAREERAQGSELCKVLVKIAYQSKQNLARKCFHPSRVGKRLLFFLLDALSQPFLSRLFFSSRGEKLHYRKSDFLSGGVRKKIVKSVRVKIERKSVKRTLPTGRKFLESEKSREKL